MAKGQNNNKASNIVAAVLIAVIAVGVFLYMYQPELLILGIIAFIYAGSYALIAAPLYFGKEAVQKRPKALSMLIFSIPDIVIFAIFAIFIVPGTGLNPGITLILAVLIATPFLGVLWTKSLDKATRELEEESKENRRRAFCKEAREFGLSGKKRLSAADKQRLELLAQKYQIKYNDISELKAMLAEALPQQEEADRRIREGILDEMRAQETRELAALTQYGALHGQDKPMTILYDEAQRSFAVAKGTTYMPTRKESDGAIMAGMAAGIGGVIPAAMSLNSTAQTNAKIRAHNNMANQYNAIMAMGSAAAEEMGNRMMAERSTYSTKLIGKQSPEELMELLSFSNTKLDTSETGAAYVTTEVSAKPVTIFDNMPAFIDGSIIAEICDGDTVVGRAAMVFPLYGTDSRLMSGTMFGEGTPYARCFNGVEITNYNFVAGRELGSHKTKLIGMCPDCCTDPKKKYTVRFAPGDLWAMER